MKNPGEIARDVLKHEADAIHHLMNKITSYYNLSSTALSSYLHYH